jgi:hypothetical protein
MLQGASWRYGVPAVVLTSAAALSWFVVPALPQASEAQVVAAAITLDLTLIVPGLVYALLVRTKRLPLIVLLPTFVTGYAVAAGTLPREHHAALEVIRLLAIPVELVLLGCLAVVARRAWAKVPSDGGDFATRFRTAARTALGSRVPADILTTEIALLYHAFRWGRAAPPGLGAYTVHRQVGYLPVMFGLAVALAFEMVVVHLFVSQWSIVAAWVLTGLSLYAGVWLLGDCRAMAARPLYLTLTHLALRVGLRWEVDIPFSLIMQAELLPALHDTPPSDTLTASLLGQPNLRLRLREPVEVTGMYGLRRTVREIWLSVDGAADLCAELQRRLAVVL